jgi:hypothetical protein
MIGILAILYFLIGTLGALLFIHQFKDEIYDDAGLVIVSFAILWPAILFLVGSLWLFATIIEYIRRRL